MSPRAKNNLGAKLLADAMNSKNRLFAVQKNDRKMFIQVSKEDNARKLEEISSKKSAYQH